MSKIGGKESMSEELKLFLQQNEVEQKKYLTIFKTGSVIYCFGKNGISLSNYDKYDEKSAKNRGMFHLLILALFALYSVIKCGKIWPGVVAYICGHLIITIIGLAICNMCSKKLDKIESDCQGKLDEFVKMNYEKTGILRYADHDEIKLDHNAVLNGNSFTGDFDAFIEPIHIYCVNNSKDKYIEGEEIVENCINMKKNIASAEFNQKFEVFVPKELEQECMKILSPSTQLMMLKSSVFDNLGEIHIYKNRIWGTRDKAYVRPNDKIDAYTYQAIIKTFEKIEEYCKIMRRTADGILDLYEQLETVVSKEK